MKVALLGTTLEIPDGPSPLDPESVPEYAELKRLVEEEFFNYFDVRINITNWEYIINRGLGAHAV